MSQFRPSSLHHWTFLVGYWTFILSQPLGSHLAFHVTARRVYPFFEIFFTVLIFSDILMVLISLRYSSTYSFVFRNSGYAVATVFIRLALTSPNHVSVLLGVGAAVFALGVTLAYNAFAPILQQADQEVRDHKHPVE